MNGLRVGVICEGPTDFHAISQFMGQVLQRRGVSVVFIDVQPDLGNTFPEGGWGNVEAWLERNPPKFRVRQYIGGGLFQNSLSAKACDVFLFQMDSDIVNSESFINRMKNKYDFEVNFSSSAHGRGEIVGKVLRLWSRVDELTDIDARRHIYAPSVESTETWCVAAYRVGEIDFEALIGGDLVNEFMTALEEFERVPLKARYSDIDKSVKRRQNFCQAQAHRAERITRRCPHFDRAISDIESYIHVSSSVE